MDLARQLQAAAAFHHLEPAHGPLRFVQAAVASGGAPFVSMRLARTRWGLSFSPPCLEEVEGLLGLRMGGQVSHHLRDSWFSLAGLPHTRVTFRVARPDGVLLQSWIDGQGQLQRWQSQQPRPRKEALCGLIVQFLSRGLATFRRKLSFHPHRVVKSSLLTRVHLCPLPLFVDNRRVDLGDWMATIPSQGSPPGDRQGKEPALLCDWLDRGDGARLKLRSSLSSEAVGLPVPSRGQHERRYFYWSPQLQRRRLFPIKNGVLLDAALAPPEKRGGDIFLTHNDCPTDASGLAPRDSLDWGPAATFLDELRLHLPTLSPGLGLSQGWWESLREALPL